MRAVLRQLILGAIVLALAVPAGATSYVMMDDGDLADGAAAIVYGRVLSVGMSPDDPQGTTRYRFEVERAVKGSVPAPVLELDVPGGLPRADGSWMVYWGMPSFQPGERALLFLHGAENEAYGVHQLLLGAFHELSDGGHRLALRALAESTELTMDGKAVPGRDRVRDLEAFITWLEARERGERRAQDYFVDLPPDRASRLGERFRIFGEDQGVFWRRFAFDDGGSFDFVVHEDGQPGMVGGGLAEIAAALAAWTSDFGSIIRMGLETSSDPVTPHSCDPPDKILFDDPFDAIEGSFACDQGGVVGVGGGCARGPERELRGDTFVDLFRSFVISQDGAGCVFAGHGGKTGEEFFGHEFGHGLGIGHPCGKGTEDPKCDHPLYKEALMFPFLRHDGRGAALNADDRAAADFLYRRSDPDGWFTSPVYPDYRFRVEIKPSNQPPFFGEPVSECLGEAVCVAGALPGRAGTIIRIIGPRNNGKLWPTIVKLTPTEIVVSIEQIPTGVVQTYTLRGARPGFDELPGLFDREGFDPL